MIDNNYYSQENHGPYEIHNIGDFVLEEGGTLRGCKIAYSVVGELNAAKDNAILFPTWYGGTNRLLEDVFIGSGRALDPGKYCIILVNQIGGGLSTSPHNTPAPGGMGYFPHVSIGDDVRAQHKLLTEKFGIESLELVVGGSMGAQQTYEWAVRFPDMVKRAAPIAGTAKTTDHTHVFSETMIDSITSDPGYNGGFYNSNEDVRDGLMRHSKMWAVMGWNPEFFQQDRHKGLGFSSTSDFLTNFMFAHYGVMDPNNLLCMARKWQGGDVSRNENGDFQAAMARVKAKMYVMPISTDMFFTPEDCRLECSMISNAEFRPLTSTDGHAALFGTDASMLEQLDKNLKELLAIDI